MSASTVPTDSLLAGIDLDETTQPVAATGGLAALIEARRAELAASLHVTQEIVGKALALRDFDGIAQALSCHFRGFPGIVVECGSYWYADLNTISWHVSPSGLHRFTIPARIWDIDPHVASIIIARWICCLKIAERYDGSVRRCGTAFFSVGDWSNGPTMCFCDNRPDALLIPDSSFLASDGYQAARAWGEESVSPPWSVRQPVAIWRGSSTGAPAGSLLDIPRAKLCALGLGSEFLDAGITEVVQAASEQDAEMLRRSGLCKPHVTMRDHGTYRYQIDIDGNTSSWPGLFQKLLTGSPVLKVLSPDDYRQWYYPRLVPWYNYVPIASDMSDLFSVIEYLREHDSLAQSIGAAGRELAMRMTIDAEIELAMPTVEAAFAIGNYVARS